MDLKKYIRDIPDFPKKGILFHDITTLFKNSEAFKYALNKLAEYFSEQEIDYVAGVEARGFIVGGALSQKLNCGFIPIRKPGKLPAEIIFEEYELEYGTDKIEVHADAVNKGDKILLVDDLVATGGTLKASIKLFEKLEARIIGIGTIIDMPDLGGRAILNDYNYYYIVEYLGD